MLLTGAASGVSSAQTCKVMMEPTSTPKTDFPSTMEPAPEIAPTRKSITKPAEAELIVKASATLRRATPLGTDILAGKRNHY